MERTTNDDTPKNILVIGGTGWLGSQITNELLKSKEFPVVRVMVRKETKEKKKDFVQQIESLGGETAVGDVNDLQSMVDAMKGIDTIVSVVGFESLLEQLKIVEAAKKAGGIKRIVPSEYGYDILSLPDDPLMMASKKVLESIKEASFDYTVICTGGFYEFITSGLFEFDVENAKAELPGTGHEVIFATSISDVAKFVPEILLDPISRNNKIFISGERITFRKIIRLFEKYSGKKFDVNYRTLQEIVQKEQNTQDPNIQVGLHLKYLSLVDSNPPLDHTSRYSPIPLSFEQYVQSHYQKKE